MFEKLILITQSANSNCQVCLLVYPSIWVTKKYITHLYINVNIFFYLFEILVSPWPYQQYFDLAHRDIYYESLISKYHNYLVNALSYLLP